MGRGCLLGAGRIELAFLSALVPWLQISLGVEWNESFVMRWGPSVIIWSVFILSSEWQ